MQRIALIDDNGNVVNTAVFPDDWNGDKWGDHQTVSIPPSTSVSPGWTYTGGAFAPPPVVMLTATLVTITAADTTLVTYTNTFDDAPAEVTFTVNGATETVALTDGTAELVVTPAGPGDITITVDQPAPPIVITVEETL